MGIGAVRTKRGGYFSVHVNGLWPVQFPKVLLCSRGRIWPHTHIPGNLVRGWGMVGGGAALRARTF